MIYLKVQLSPSLLYFPEGQSVGKRYIQVPHVDESKLGELKDFKFIHGGITRLDLLQKYHPIAHSEAKDSS